MSKRDILILALVAVFLALYWYKRNAALSPSVVTAPAAGAFKPDLTFHQIDTTPPPTISDQVKSQVALTLLK